MALEFLQRWGDEFGGIVLFAVLFANILGRVFDWVVFGFITKYTMQFVILGVFTILYSRWFRHRFLVYLAVAALVAVTLWQRFN